MQLKVGIAGVRGLNTLPVFNAIPGVNVEAMCDLKEEVLKAQASKHNIPKDV